MNQTLSGKNPLRCSVNLKILIMKIKQFDIWIADLKPKIGTEPGKTRPVIIVQTNLLNNVQHPSTLICPLTTNVKKNSEILRVHLPKGTSNLNYDCDIMIDQIRAIDNKRLINKIGKAGVKISNKVKDNLRILMEL